MSAHSSQHLVRCAQQGAAAGAHDIRVQSASATLRRQRLGRSEYSGRSFGVWWARSDRRFCRPRRGTHAGSSLVAVATSPRKLAQAQARMRARCSRCENAPAYQFLACSGRISALVSIRAASGGARTGRAELCAPAGCLARRSPSGARTCSERDHEDEPTQGFPAPSSGRGRVHGCASGCQYVFELGCGRAPGLAGSRRLVHSRCRPRRQTRVPHELPIRRLRPC